LDSAKTFTDLLGPPTRGVQLQVCLAIGFGAMEKKELLERNSSIEKADRIARIPEERLAEMLDRQFKIARPPLCQTAGEIGNAEIELPPSRLKLVCQACGIEGGVPLVAQYVETRPQRDQGRRRGFTIEPAKNHGFGLGQLRRRKWPGHLSARRYNPSIGHSRETQFEIALQLESRGKQLVGPRLRETAARERNE